MATVLMVGVGRLGSELAKSLLAAGHKVHGVKRSEANLLTGVDYHYLNVCEPWPAEFVSEQLPKHIDYVFITLTPSEYNDAAYLKTYVKGVKCTVEGIKDRTIKRCFFISSTSVLGDGGGEVMTESVDPKPTAYSGKRLLEAERSLSQFAPWPVTVMRFAGIYGPGRYRLIEKAESISAGREPWPKNIWTNRIHIDDCVAVLHRLLDADVEGVAVSALYHGVDNEPVPSHTVLKYIMGVAGWPIPVGVEGAEAVQASNKQVANNALRELAYEYRFEDYKAGYAAVLADWQAR